MYVRICVGGVDLMWISEDRLNELLQLAEDHAMKVFRAELNSALEYHDIGDIKTRVTGVQKVCDECLVKWDALYDRMSDLESLVNRSDQKALEFESEMLNSQLLLTQEIQKMRENFESVDSKPIQNLGELTVKSSNIIELDALVNTVKTQASQGRKATVSVIIQPEPARLAIKKKGGK